MAVKRRFRYFSGIRADIPHLRSLESAVTADFDDLIKGMFTGLDRPYVIRGFDLNFAADNGSPSNIQLTVADSAILHTTATESGSILTIPSDEPILELNPSNSKIIGSWSSNAINYVALDYRRVTGENTIDQVAAWSQQDDTEIQKSVATGTLLDYRIIITTSGFGNYLPLYKVYVTQPVNQGQQIGYIERCKPDLFRLGTGGLVPDPYNSYQWTEDNGSRLEGELRQDGAITPTSKFWKTGDFSIKNFKDWADATMSRFKELTGSVYWYADTNLTGSPLNLNNLFFDSGAGSVFTSDGKFSFNLQAKIVTPVSEDYDVGFNTKLADLYSSVNWDSYYKDQVRIFDLDPITEDELGRGILNRANGTIALISSLEGLFTAGDKIRARVRVPITSLDVTAPSSGIAEIQLASWTLFDGTQSIFASDSLTFRGTISGASDPAYNGTDVVITINGGDQKEMTYSVSTSITLPATGNLFLDGIVYEAEMAPSLVGDPNPAAGPVSFDEDILINAVIGRKTITVAKEALAVELDNGSTVQDPIYGAGTFQLKNDDEVAFIVVERNLAVGGAGAVYTSANSGTQTVTGPVPSFSGYYGPSQVVRVGDYIRFDGASESEWRRVEDVTQLSGIYTIELDEAFSAPYTASFTGKIVVFRGIYGQNPDTLVSEPVIQIAHRKNVPANPNVFWLAYRKDRNENSTVRPTVYLREMELEIGEERSINDNQTQNHLIYTGALSEANKNPNYSLSTNAAGYEFQVNLTVSQKDVETNTVYFAAGPDLGFMQGDLIYDGSSGNTYTVAFPLTATECVVNEDIQSLSLGTVQYRRPNSTIIDGDNLTVGERKLDRMLAYLITSLTRPIYDESVYIQSLTVSGAGTINSGDWLETSGPALAWVLAGEGETKDLTGSVIPNTILIHVVSGTVANGQTLTQGVTVKTATSNPTDIALYGNSANGQDLKLPPNQRVIVPDNLTSGPTGTKVYPHAVFAQKTGRGGGELFVIANDTPRECGVDYAEISGGPGTSTATRAKIRLIRPLPLFTRIRFRNLATFGKASEGASGVISLQNAYNGSTSGGGDATIDTILGKPVWIRPPASNVLGLRVSGRAGVDGPNSAMLSIVDKESSLGLSTNRWSNVWAQQENIKAHDNYSGSESVKTTVASTSIGTTPVVAYQKTIPQYTAIRIKISAIGRNDTSISGPDAQSGFAVDAVLRREAGSAALIGAPITNIIGMSQDSFQHAVIVQASGNDVQVAVAGGTGQTCHWALTIEYQEIATGA